MSIDKLDAEKLVDVVDEYLHWRKANPHIKGGENYLKRLSSASKASEQPVDMTTLVDELIGELDYDCSNWRNILSETFKAKWRAAKTTKREVSGEWLYAYRQNIMQDGVEKHFITLSAKYPCTLKDAECLGRISLHQIEVGGSSE